MPKRLQHMAQAGQPGHDFRFFDNREKYLQFVTTTSEKWAIAERIGRDVAQLAPEPPALRIFDAGTGDGTVLGRVMRRLHHHFPTVPFLVVGKEVSLEDVRLTLARLPDRFAEHPQTVVVLTNLYYSQAPWLRPSAKRIDELNWIEVPLDGQTVHDYDCQIEALNDVLNEGWQVTTSEKTGNPLYVRPSVLVLYPKQQRYILDRIIPRKAEVLDGRDAAYDLVLAAQPYRSRLPAETKVSFVLEPLSRALAPGGRLIGIQSTGRGPSMEIVQALWPDDDPFPTPRHRLLEALEQRLGDAASDLVFEPLEDADSLFRYNLRVMASEVGESIGTSTLLAAWNAAIYVAQIPDDRLRQVLAEGRYVEVTAEVLRRHGGLWFFDESFVVRRHPEPGR